MPSLFASISVSTGIGVGALTSTNEFVPFSSENIVPASTKVVPAGKVSGVPLPAITSRPLLPRETPSRSIA